MSSGEKAFLTNYEEYFERSDPEAIALVEGFADLFSEEMCEELKKKTFEEVRSSVLSSLLSVHNEADSWNPYDLLERGYYKDH